MATLTGFTRPPDPIIMADLSAEVTTAMGSSCEAIVIDSSNITVIGNSISEANRAAIQSAIDSYVFTNPLIPEISGSQVIFHDVTDNNVSTAMHGYFPKLPTASGLYLKDDLTWGSPGGGVADGDKGDITVSASGTTWTVDNGAIIEGFIVPSANGTVIARFASEVLSSAITAKAGAVVYYQQVA